MTKSEITQALRSVADKIEAGQTLSDSDMAAVGTAARLSNNYNLGTQGAGDPNTMTRSAFDGLSHEGRAAFVKQGGRIVNDPA